MGYVIYRKDTTQILRVIRRGHWQLAQFETQGAAKAALTRMKKDSKFNADEYSIAEQKKFHQEIEKTEVRHGIVGSDGKKFTVPVNTPWTSGPWSETYWSS